MISRLVIVVFGLFMVRFGLVALSQIPESTHAIFFFLNDRAALHIPLRNWPEPWMGVPIHGSRHWLRCDPALEYDGLEEGFGHWCHRCCLVRSCILASRCVALGSQDPERFDLCRHPWNERSHAQWKPLLDSSRDSFTLSGRCSSIPRIMTLRSLTSTFISWNKISVDWVPNSRYECESIVYKG